MVFFGAGGDRQPIAARLTRETEVSTLGLARHRLPGRLWVQGGRMGSEEADPLTNLLGSGQFRCSGDSLISFGFAARSQRAEKRDKKGVAWSKS